MNDNVTVIDIVAQVTDNTASGANSAQQNISKLEQSMQKLQQKIQSMKGMSKLEVVATLKDMATSGIKKILSAGKSIAGKVWTVTMKAVDLVTAPFKSVLKLITSPVTQVAAFAGISLGLSDTINTFKEFEQGMANVKAISGASDEEFAQLTETAKALGESTQFSAAQAAEAMENLAMAGWKSQDIISGMPGLLDLAAAGSVDLATASDVTASALAQFKMGADEAGRVADVLAATATNSKTDVAGLGESLKYAGSLAGALGYTIEDVSVALGLMGNAAIDGSSAGTALRATLARMSKQEGLSEDETNAVVEAMQKMGVSLTDASGKSKSLMTIMQDMRKGYANLADAEKTATMANLAGQEAMSGMLAIVQASDEDFEKLTAAINDSTGAAADMAEVKMDTLQGSLYYLQSAAEGAKIAIGEKLEPYVKGLIDWPTQHMPEIQSIVGTAVDWITGKIDGVIESVHALTASSAWTEAETLWEKIKLAWDKLIAEPFDEWWSSTGKTWLADKAASIGEGLGTALNHGILALLGVDVESAVSEGTDIGKSFADAFTEAFDGKKVGEALWTAIKGGMANLVSDAATLLPGGEEASSTSGASAALLTYGAVKAASAGYKTVRAVKSVGNTIGTLTGATEAASGAATAAEAASGITKVGQAVSKVAVPLAAVASIAEMGVDAYQGTGKAEEWNGSDSTGSKVAAAAGAALGGTGGGILGDESAGKKFLNIGGGALKGAGIGAAIGSVIPVVGTAVGGAIGATVGAIGAAIGGENISKGLFATGNAVKESFTGTERPGTFTDKRLEKVQLEKAQKIFEATGYAMEEITFETSTLQKAIDNTGVSAEKFGQLFQDAIGENLQKHFGDIELSMQEIRDLADQIVFDGYAESLNEFATAVENSESSLAALQSRMQTIDRLNWKAELGFTLSESDIQNYKDSMDALVSEADAYLKDRNYEADVSVRLLLGEGTEIESGMDAVYADLQTQMESASSELQRVVDEALSDGVISTEDKIKVSIGGVEYELDEATAVTTLQNKIAEIANKVSDAEQGAKLETLKIRYGGAQLDADSFASLQAELQADVTSFTDSYNQALEVGITNLKLELSEGAIDQAAYDAQLQQLTEGYNAHISDLRLTVESFQLDTIADAYGESLDGILPDIAGTTSEKLQAAMQNALAIEPDPTQWDTKQVAAWFGLESLGVETQTALAGLLQQTAATISQDMSEAMGAASFSETGSTVAEGVGAAIQEADTSPIQSAVDELKSNTDAYVNDAFSAGVSATMPVNVTADYQLTNPTATISVSGSGGGSATVTASITPHAEGGIMTAPHLGLVAEDGDEAIIPLSSRRRDRGLAIWEKAGEILGVKAYAGGGIVGVQSEVAPTTNSAVGNIMTIADSSEYGKYGKYGEYGEAGLQGDRSGVDTPPEATQESPEAPEPVQVPEPPQGTNNGMNVPVTIENITLEVHIDGGEAQNPQALVDAIRENVRGMTGEIAYQLALAMEQVYANTPTAAW